MISLMVAVLTVATLVASEKVMAQTVTESGARTVALNFLQWVHSDRAISTVDPVFKDGKLVGYLVQLSPRGYVLVAGNTLRVPVKGYSFNSTFAKLPAAYVENLLTELEVPDSAQKTAQSLEGDVNAPYWDFLSSSARSPLSLDYSPDTYLLTTQWAQGYPYNKLNPEDGGELTVTGCVQTALAQLMRYHRHPATGSGVFSHWWNGQNLIAVMKRPFNWEAMPDVVSGAVPVYQQDEVAALMRDLGILNKADFGVHETSTSFNSTAFQRAFGYAAVHEMYIQDPDFFNTIRNEIDNLRPVMLSMPGHMTVADGYASDNAGNRIHLNLGWGGYCDDYYTLDQTNIIGSGSYPPDHTIYYNIRPCQGGECDPYPALGGGKPPEIGARLKDMTIDGETILRVEARDLDGDAVTLTAASSCPALQVQMDGNLLTLKSSGEDYLCQVTVHGQTHDGSAEESFNVLCLGEKIHLGANFDLGGQFADRTEVDSYTVYLDGQTTLSGTRGYSNQAFYIWVTDQNGQTVIDALDDTRSGNLPAGLYTVKVSLTNAAGTSFYDNDDPAYSGYTVTVTCENSTYTVLDLAADLGIGLFMDLTGDGGVGLDDLVFVLRTLTGSELPPAMNVDLDGDGKIGLTEAVYLLKQMAQ